MAQQVVITSVTANTPVDIYYCDSTMVSCIFVATVSVFPFTFSVPDPIDYTNFIIKIVDSQGCIDTDTIYITPTPTASITPSLSFSPTPTNTSTVTPTNTNTQTPTNSVTPTYTPTNTATPTTTPVVAYHPIGQNVHSTTANTCNDIITLTNYYTYISEANSVPVIGVKVYKTLLNGVLYNPYNGGNKFILMGFGSLFYAVQIDTSGSIIGYTLCTNLVTPTQTVTSSPTMTPTMTQTNTPTAS